MRPQGKPLRILVTDTHELAGISALRSLGRAGHIAIAGYPENLKRSASVWSRYCFFGLCYPDS